MPLVNKTLRVIPNGCFQRRVSYNTASFISPPPTTVLVLLRALLVTGVYFVLHRKRYLT